MRLLVEASSPSARSAPLRRTSRTVLGHPGGLVVLNHRPLGRLGPVGRVGSLPFGGPYPLGGLGQVALQVLCALLGGRALLLLAGELLAHLSQRGRVNPGLLLHLGGVHPGLFFHLRLNPSELLLELGHPGGTLLLGADRRLGGRLGLATLNLGHPLRLLSTRRPRVRCSHPLGGLRRHGLQLRLDRIRIAPPRAQLVIGLALARHGGHDTSATATATGQQKDTPPVTAELGDAHSSWNGSARPIFRLYFLCPGCAGRKLVRTLVSDPTTL